MRNPVRAGGAVAVITADGATHAFDRVIVATHADQALRLLVNPTPDEVRLLGEFKYEAVTATLHTDASVLPRAPRARAAWNCQLSRDDTGRIRPAIHRRLDAAQGGSDHEHRFVTINHVEGLDEAKILRRIEYRRPLFTPGTARVQQELPRLNEQARGRTETYFAGSYFRHGFHEDGVMSAVQLAGLLLDRDPWGELAC